MSLKDVDPVNKASAGIKIDSSSKNREVTMEEISAKPVVDVQTAAEPSSVNTQEATARADGVTPAKEAESDFSAIDQAVLFILAEQYRSLRASYSSSADTSNRMIQFLALASAGLGGFAVNYLLRGDNAGVWMSSVLFLIVLPGTIAVLYLAWVREFLQKARASLLSLRLEGRISRFVVQLQHIFQETSTSGRRQTYAALQEVFGSRFIDSEIWMRGENPAGKDLIEKRAHVAIAIVFFNVAIVSMNFGFLIGASALQSQCAGQNVPPLQQLAVEIQSKGLTGLIFPLNAYRATQVVCAGNIGQVIGHGLLAAYVIVLSFGMAVTAYTIHLLLIVRKITIGIRSEFYGEGADKTSGEPTPTITEIQSR